MKHYVLFYIAIVYTLLVPLAAALLVGAGTAAVLSLVGIVMIVITRIDDIELFKLWGLEARLRQKIDEASATVEQLKRLASAIAEPAISSLAMHDQMMRRLNLSYRHKMKGDIDHMLREIGVSNEKISEIGAVWNQMMAYRLARHVVEGENVSEQVWKDWQELAQAYEHERPVPPGKVEAFLKERKMWGSDRARRLEDYKHFIGTGEVRDQKWLESR
jgi:hypothetical protein